jgi:hypothetical protein
VLRLAFMDASRHPARFFNIQRRAMVPIVTTRHESLAVGIDA